jgi:hypothetical protein
MSFAEFQKWFLHGSAKIVETLLYEHGYRKFCELSADVEHGILSMSEKPETGT